MSIRHWRSAITTSIGVAATIGVLVTVGLSAALVIGMFAAAVAVVRYGLVGASRYAGAILSCPPDELHARARLRARAGAAGITLLVAVAAAVVARALGEVVWPFELIVAVGVASFLVDLLFRGSSRGGAVADFGEVLSPRADERQVELRLHALQLAAITMALASTIGLLVFTGGRADEPFEIFDVALGATFVAGLVIHRLRG